VSTSSLLNFQPSHYSTYYEQILCCSLKVFFSALVFVMLPWLKFRSFHFICLPLLIYLLRLYFSYFDTKGGNIEESWLKIPFSTSKTRPKLSRCFLGCRISVKMGILHSKGTENSNGTFKTKKTFSLEIRLHSFNFQNVSFPKSLYSFQFLDLIMH